MYTLSCLQVAYEFLNREWMFLIYGEQKKTWYKSLKNWINQWYLNIMNAANFKIDYQFIFKKNYQFLIIVIIMSLGAFFTVYKVMKKLQLLEVKKYFMDFHWWRNENSNKISPAFHENNNESPQLTEDFTTGTSLTAIVKPTIRTSETWEAVKAKDGTYNSGKKNISSKLTSSQDVLTLSEAKKSEHDSDATRIRGEMISSMRKIFEKRPENVDMIKPLVKCSSSLYVVTSKDSLNAELLTEYITENTKSQLKETQKRGMRVNNKTNNNLTFAVHESSSIFEVDDVISSVFEDTISHYQSSINAFPSPDTPAFHKNSSCVSGHFLEQLPDLDLSPIPNLSPKNRNHDQSLRVELSDKEVQEAESKDTGKGSRDRRYFSRSLSCSPRRSEKSSERFLTCFDYKTNSFDEKPLSRMHSKIPRLNFPLQSNDICEGATSFSPKDALDIAGSKIPIPLKKDQINFSPEVELNESSRKTGTVRIDHKKDCFGSKESEQSLEKFLQLEIATGCYNTNDFKSLPLSKS